jgi:ABC-type transport system involved in cytochrome bd biosynthesis fused ATPase/permease subunit
MQGTGLFIAFHVVHAAVMFLAMVFFEGRSAAASGTSAVAAGASERDAATDHEAEDDDVKELRRAVLGAVEKPLLHVAGLRKEYPPSARHGGKAKVACNSLSLQVKRGECLCLLGPNGAGKTTFFGSLAGKLVPTAGAVSVAGFDLATQVRCGAAWSWSKCPGNHCMFPAPHHAAPPFMPRVACRGPPLHWIRPSV